METKKQPSILLFERIKAVIDKEPALKLRLSRADQPVAGKNGRLQNFPREIVQIAQMLHRGGAAVNRVTQKEIVRVACEIIDLEKPETAAAGNGESEPAQPAKPDRPAKQKRIAVEKKTPKPHGRRTRWDRGVRRPSVAAANPVQKEMDQTAAVFGVPNEQDGPAPEAPEAQEENTPVIPQTEADDAQAGAALEPDVVPINPQPTKEAPSVELPDQPPAPGGSVEESPIDGNVDGKPATPPTWPSVEAKDTTQPPRVYNEAYDVLNLYVVCYTNTAAVADIVETHDKAPGHENRLRVLTDLVVQFRALAKTAQNKSNSACESVN